MEVRSVRLILMMVVIGGLMVALPLTAGDTPGLENENYQADNAPYQPVLPPRDFAPYNPQQPGFKEDATLTPSEINVIMDPGETFFESKVLHIPENVVPPKADVVFVLDATGSMGQEIANVKANAISIMTQVRSVVPDTYFGVISHQDYNAYYDYCQYSATYGSSNYPYRLDQALTDDMSAVQTALNGISAFGGQDSSESYARALFECYSDAAVNWRAGTKKIVVLFGDYVPHDCNVYECIGQSMSTGQDPGRNGTIGDADDIPILDAINGLVTNNICLIPLFSGAPGKHFDSWNCWAAMTGCSAFQLNSDGTVPGGTDIATYITDAIGQEIGHINTLTLRICDDYAQFAGWLVGVTPPSYTDIDLDVPKDFPFQLEFKVPDDAVPGEQYCFDVCAVGDDVEYARQHVCVTIREPGDDCIHLDIGEIWGNPGDDVLVPVYIQDVTGWDIYAFETMICWCETPTGLIQYEGCLPGTVIDGSDWGDPVCGICAPNCVTVADAGAGPLAGGGVLFYLKFHISLNAKPGMCCEICFEYANVYDPENPLEVCLECGWVCVNECGIGGSVYAWWCYYDPCCGWLRWRPIEGVRMHLSDCEGSLMTTFTDGDGEYFFGGLPPMDDCQYCVDIDFCTLPDALITAYDASLVLQYVVCQDDLMDCPFDICAEQGLSSQTIYPQQVAANVSCTSGITSYDASLILQYVVGAIPAFPCPDPWAWYVVNACGNCVPACPFDLDWVGVLIGDVSGRMPPALAEEADVSYLKVGIPRHFSDRVEVPILVEDAVNVQAFEFNLRFNDGDFSVINVAPVGLASGFSSAFNPNGNELLVAMAGSGAFSGTGRVAMITFQKLRPLVPTASPRVELIDGIFNEGQPEMVIKSNEIGREIWRLGLEPAKPNPFGSETVLRFSLPEASSVTLAIYNVNGQLVRTLENGTVAAGSHQVTWDGTDDTGARVARGVYFCRMDTPSFSATEKVVMLK